jgi:citrate lyase subunit beta/citryl-CoA lyase
MTYTAGNRGDSVRSDCWVSLSIDNSSGISINLESKVKALYGKSINTLCFSILNFFGIKNATVTIEDKGALPFAIASRIETVINMAGLNGKEYNVESSVDNGYVTPRKLNRFSRL